MRPKILKGKKTVLREKRSSDAVNDYRWRVDEELAELDAAGPLRMGYEEYLRIYEQELLYSSYWSRRFAIDNLEQKQIGNCMYYDIDYVRCHAELGILIGDREFWGRGFGTDAVNTLLGYIFSSTSLNKIYLHTLEWNLRAQRSFAKSGFLVVKPVTRSGKDFIRMEINKSRWEMLRDLVTTSSKVNTKN